MFLLLLFVVVVVAVADDSYPCVTTASCGQGADVSHSLLRTHEERFCKAANFTGDTDG